MSDNHRTEQTADFGFRTVPAAAKRGLVRQVFDSVAPRYDLMNDLMSLGIHRVWKRRLNVLLDPRPGRLLLDLAGGTGDVSLAWLRAGGERVLLTDINPNMLAHGQDRAFNAGLPGELFAVVADAERLPFRDAIAERVTIAFGLRNCTNKQAVLAEARRMLKPGGRFFCLEFSPVQVFALAPLYDAWSFQVLPRLGRFVAGDEESYRYLAESIRTFPDPETLAGMMRTAGFARVGWEKLSGGIAAIHWGWRL